MLIERHTDPAAYARLVTPLLLRDEPRFNLELAVVGRLAGGESFGEAPPVLLTVGDGAAMMTPPFNLLLAAVPRAAAKGLAEYAVAHGVHPPGVLGEPDTARAFAGRYAALTGAGSRVTREQGVYALRTLVPPRPTSGVLRTAAEADADLVVEWSVAFQREVGLPDDRGSVERMRGRVAEGLVWLWEDAGEVVSLAGCGGFTPNGARVGPVYTPPGRRGRGYASAVTAGATRALLDRGLTSAFLYTDLANPTSNKIYRAIGYEHVTDVIEVTFDR